MEDHLRSINIDGLKFGKFGIKIFAKNIALIASCYVDDVYYFFDITLSGSRVIFKGSGANFLERVVQNSL